MPASLFIAHSVNLIVDLFDVCIM